MRKNKKKGFILVLLLLLTTVFSTISLALISYYYTISEGYYNNMKRLQATNYTAEGEEMVRGYITTVINKDKINGWKNTISPISGNYIIGFDSSGYTLISGEYETIEQDEPFFVDYIRTIEINDGDSNDEKKITVTVDYGGDSNVSFETTLVNLYGE